MCCCSISRPAHASRRSMLGDMTVRPFLTGRYIAVQDMAYYWGWGGGAEL